MEMEYLQQIQSLEENLAIVRKLRDEKRILVNNIDEISELKLTILKKEVEARNVLAEYLREDSQLLSLKKDVEEDIPLSQVALNEAEMKKKKEMEMESTTCSLLGRFNEELKDTQKAVELTFKVISVLTGAASKTRKDLSSALKERSEKHTQLTDFARTYASSPAQELPTEVLCMIFSVLPTEDLVTVGQVCQRWRRVSRSEREDLWTNRKLVLKDPSAGARMGYLKFMLFLEAEPITRGLMRILFAAPTLGHVAFDTNFRKHVRDTRCKVLGMDLTNEEIFGFSGLFKRHAQHLTSLTLRFWSSNVARVVSNLPHLKELTLLVYSSYKSYVTFPSDMKSSIERLRLSGHVSFATLNSLPFPLAATLKSLSLESAENIPKSPEGRENLVSLLGQCVSLEELKLRVCHHTLDFSRTSIKLKCLTLVVTSCLNFMCPPLSLSMPPSLLFAQGSVDDLKIVWRDSQIHSKVANFIKFLKPAFRASLKSVSFTCLITLSAEINMKFESDIKEIPEFREDKCVFKWPI